MSQDEFQKKYHDFHTKDREVAIKEAEAANAIGIDNDKAIVVDFGDLGCGLMLKSAADF